MSKNLNQAGFSVAELLIVFVIMGILISIAMMSFFSSTKYAADDQSKKIVDFFDEARQKALNQRTTFRVEINKTKQQLLLIDENVNENGNDDVVVKRGSFSKDAVIGVQPPSVTDKPTTTSPTIVLEYASSSYPPSTGDEKITVRFKKNGQVHNAGSDNIGTGSVPTGATIYVHSNKPSAAKPDIVRAVVLLGTTGDASIYKCTYKPSGICGDWKK